MSLSCRYDKWKYWIPQDRQIPHYLHHLPVCVCVCVYKVLRMTLYSIHRSCFTATLGLSVYFSRDVAARRALQRSFENVSAFKLADQDRWSTFARARGSTTSLRSIDRPIDRAASLIELMPNFWPPSSKRPWLLSSALARSLARARAPARVPQLIGIIVGGHFMHREHAPRLRLEYRIREIEGERRKERRAKRDGRGVVGVTGSEAVHRNSRRLPPLSTPVLSLLFPIPRPF